jgi:putative ABC transport system permease protein
MTMTNAVRELRLAVRSLRRRPSFTIVATATLALGIGATVAMFTVVNSVLLRPLPYPDSDRIVTVRHHAPGINLPELQSSPGLIEHYRASSTTLTRIAGYEMRQRNLTGSGQPDRVRTVAVTPEFFDALAVRPAIGRAFSEADARGQAPLVGILADSLWRSRFGADPGIVGRHIQADGRTMEIVGVMPPRFAFPDPDTRLIVPLWLDPERGFGTFGMRTLARLAPGASIEAARQEVAALQRRIPERFPDLTQDTLDRFRWSVTLDPLRDTVVRDIVRPLWILFASVAFVLVIAGANVVNLLLVRAESRKREVAVRAALGGSRGRIAATFLAESTMLAAGGGLLGSAIAAAGVQLLRAYGPAQLPRLHEISVDATSLIFASTLSLAVGVAVGMAPLSGLARRSFAQVLRDGGRGVTAGRHRHLVRRLLIVGQVAMALVLLVGSGLMLQSVARLSRVDPGFRADGLLTAGVSIGDGSDRVRASAFYQRVLDELASLPGVTSVGASNSLPIEAGGMNGSSFAIQSRPRAESEIQPVTMYQAVTAGYFETLGVRLIEGRFPTRDDDAQGRPVLWVNERFARDFLGGRAIGERIQLEGNWLEIVGVVGDIRTFGLRDDIRPVAYLPPTVSMRTVSLDVMQMVIRTAGAPASLASSLRPAVDRVDASAPLMRIRTMEEIVESSFAQLSFTMTLMVIAAGLAVVLGLVGLYGVISYVVSQRTAEIGVRLALGARPGQVQAMVLRQGLGVALVGVAVGLVAAIAATRVLSALLFDVSDRDPVTFASVTAILIAVSALASYLPARRAANIDPLEAVRQD